MTYHPRLASRAAAFAVLLFTLAAPRGYALNLEALQRDGYGFVPLRRPQPNTLIVLAEIDGHKLNLVVDTGWGSEGISLQTDHRNQTAGATDSSTKHFGKSASGADIGEVRHGVAQTFAVGNVRLAQVPLNYGRFKALQQQRMIREIGADGFMGAGFLKTCSAIVDLHNLRLYLRPPGSGHRVMLGEAMRASGLAEVPFDMQSNNCLVDVEINEVPGKMILDTGAFMASVDGRLAPKMKTAGYDSHMGSMDAAGVLTRAKITKLRSFKIGGVQVRAPDIRMESFGFYNETHGEVFGLLGMDILGQNGTIIDFGARKLYFYPLK